MELQRPRSSRTIKFRHMIYFNVTLIYLGGRSSSYGYNSIPSQIFTFIFHTRLSSRFNLIYNTYSAQYFLSRETINIYVFSF